MEDDDDDVVMTNDEEKCRIHMNANDDDGYASEELFSSENEENEGSDEDADEEGSDEGLLQPGTQNFLNTSFVFDFDAGDVVDPDENMVNQHEQSFILRSPNHLRSSKSVHVMPQKKVNHDTEESEIAQCCFITATQTTSTFDITSIFDPTRILLPPPFQNQNQKHLRLFPKYWGVDGRVAQEYMNDGVSTFYPGKLPFWKVAQC